MLQLNPIKSSKILKPNSKRKLVPNSRIKSEIILVLLVMEAK